MIWTEKPARKQLSTGPIGIPNQNSDLQKLMFCVILSCRYDICAVPPDKRGREESTMVGHSLQDKHQVSGKAEREEEREAICLID